MSKVNQETDFIVVYGWGHFHIEDEKVFPTRELAEAFENGFATGTDLFSGDDSFACMFPSNYQDAYTDDWPEGCEIAKYVKETYPRLFARGEELTRLHKAKVAIELSRVAREELSDEDIAFLHSARIGGGPENHPKDPREEVKEAKDAEQQYTLEAALKLAGEFSTAVRRLLDHPARGVVEYSKRLAKVASKLEEYDQYIITMWKKRTINEHR